MKPLTFGSSPMHAKTRSFLGTCMVLALSVLLPSSTLAAQVRVTEGAQAFLDAEHDAQSDVLRKGCWYTCGCMFFVLPPLVAPYFPTPVDQSKLEGKPEVYAKRYKEVYNDIASDVQFKSARAGMFTALGVGVAVATAGIIIGSTR